MLNNFVLFFFQCSGRELFLSNASLFVDDEDADAEAYQREEEPNATEAAKVVLNLLECG